MPEAKAPRTRFEHADPILSVLLLVAILVPATACTGAQPAAASQPCTVSAPGPALGQAQVGDAFERVVDSVVVPVMASAKIAGMAVAVIAPGQDGALTARTFSYGTTARNGGKPVTSATLFEIGSETKVFTGLLLASFVVDGRVKLSDPLQNYLPPGVRAPGSAQAPITLLDLATHRSGLPRMPTNIGEGPLARARYTLEDLYEFLNQHTIRRAPGAMFEYSNLGFGVLGTVLAALGERNFETLVAERIGAPLQMLDTRITLTAEQRARLATGYTQTGAVAPEWNNTGAIAAGGGLLSTADDEARFVAAFIDPPRSALGAAIEEAQRLRPYAEQPEKVTALAWEHIRSTPSFPHDLLWKNGGTAGFYSWMGFARTARTGLALLANGIPGSERDTMGPNLLCLISGLVGRK